MAGVLRSYKLPQDPPDHSSHIFKVIKFQRIHCRIPTEFFFHFLPEKNCQYTACTFDMLQSPAGNVCLYPAIKITSNFDIDLIESFFTVFLFYLHNWRNSVIT